MKRKIIAIITILTALIIPIVSAQDSLRSGFIDYPKIIGGKKILVPSQIQKAIDNEKDNGEKAIGNEDIIYRKSKLHAELINLGDGKNGIVVIGSNGWCGAMNCSIWIYQKIAENNYLILLQESGMVVRPSKKLTRGYRDIYIETNGRDGIHTNLYQWNGKQYQ